MFCTSINRGLSGDDELGITPECSSVTHFSPWQSGTIQDLEGMGRLEYKPVFLAPNISFQMERARNLSSPSARMPQLCELQRDLVPWGPLLAWWVFRSCSRSGLMTGQCCWGCLGTESDAISSDILVRFSMWDHSCVQRVQGALRVERHAFHQ